MQTSKPCSQHFEIYYKDHCMDTTRPYDGINDLLTKLRAQGYMTAVVSNKVDFAVQDLVKDFFVGQFDVAIGEREGVRKKPAPDSVYEVLKEFDLKKDEVIYIGDSDVDYATAKNAGVDCDLSGMGFPWPGISWSRLVQLSLRRSQRIFWI